MVHKNVRRVCIILFWGQKNVCWRSNFLELPAQLVSRARNFKCTHPAGEFKFPVTGDFKTYPLVDRWFRPFSGGCHCSEQKKLAGTGQNCQSTGGWVWIPPSSYKLLFWVLRKVMNRLQKLQGGIGFLFDYYVNPIAATAILLVTYGGPGICTTGLFWRN